MIPADDIDLSRMRKAIEDTLHREFVPVWSLTPGLAMRNHPDGLEILSAEGDVLALMPWDDVPRISQRT